MENNFISTLNLKRRKRLHIWVTRGARNPLLKNTIIHILLTGTVCKPITIIGVRREAVLISFDFSRLSLLCRLCGSGGYGCILRFCCDLRKIGAYRLGRCSYLRLVGRYVALVVAGVVSGAVVSSFGMSGSLISSGSAVEMTIAVSLLIGASSVS